MSKHQAEKTTFAKPWNLKNLELRIGADATSAASASALVAPVICIIDRAIVTKSATGRHMTRLLWESAKPVLRPHRFLASRQFLLVFGVYFSTYLAANTVDTITSAMRSHAASTVTSNTPKFLATSAVNMSVCVYKDAQFAQMFGKGPSAIPKISWALFSLRDSMTIFASFNLPSIIAPKLAELPKPVQQRFRRILATESGRMNTAQFVTPAAMQIFSTPFHLLGLDFINRQGDLGMGKRVARVTRDWGVSAVARMGRIIPAFGVGGVVNAKVRKGFMKGLE